MVKLEAVAIGESEPAPLLTLVVGPSEDSKKTGETKKELAERHLQRRAFWESLLRLSNARTKLFSAVSPSHDTWIGAGAGRSGLSFNYVVNQHVARAELYIDAGKDSEVWNRVQFQSLANHRNDIEEAFGEALVWDVKESRRACRISSIPLSKGYTDAAEWPSIQEDMVDAMARLEKVLRPYLTASQ